MANKGFAPPVAAVSPGPPVHGVVVVPSDTVDLASPCRAIWVGVAGDVAVILAGDTAAVTLKAAPVGMLEVCATRVMATNTAATNMVALW